MANLTQDVITTYAAPQTFLSSDQWKQIQAALLSQLPLRNIHWKSLSRPSLRTIQELRVKLLPLDSARDEHASQIPLTILERPLLNIYMVICEDNDTYKNVVRKQIKDWHSAVSQRKNQEWMIMYVDRPDTKAATPGFFQKAVLDKIRADFNLDKRDRCVQLSWSTGCDNPSAWADVMTKMKDGLLSAFDSAIAQREEDVKRLEAQRQMPGWNFCTFFILKAGIESLACSFEGVNLCEDALLQYEELEASFFQVLREKNLSWFGTLISPGAKDDSLPLLSSDKKSYRDLILANTISIFDFRVYLLARQCSLLGRMAKVVQVARKSAAFLNTFGRRLLEVQEKLPPFFLESWTYSSALSVVEECDKWASNTQLDEPTLKLHQAGKGELVELARHQLDILGVRLGHLPPRPPFSSVSPTVTPDTATFPKDNISNPELTLALNGAEVFYDLYVRITNRAIDLFKRAGRRKFALRLHGSLAALDVHRGRLSTALQTYKSLPAHYAPHQWSSLLSFMLSQAIDIHSHLANPTDREWITILLAFLQTYVDGLGSDMLIPEDDKDAYVSGLVLSLKTAAETLDADFPHDDHHAISLILSSHDAALAETKDGSYLEIDVRNHLSCPIPADQISVVLAGRDAEKLRYTADVKSFIAGNNRVKLFCAMSSQGTYAWDSTEIRISRLVLQWRRHPSSANKSNETHQELPFIVHIPKDYAAFDVQLAQPYCTELWTAEKALVTVFSGRNHITTTTVKLSSPSGTHFQCREAFLSEEDGRSLELGDDSITLMNIEPETTISFLVPHASSSGHSLHVYVDAEYLTASEPSTVRSLRLSRTVTTSLPVSVNVQDFFRGTRLFSKFTISSTSHQFVRIRSTRLEVREPGADDLQISDCSSARQGVTTVTPTQPANVLFQLNSPMGQARESLTFTITYRMLRDEVEALISAVVNNIVPRSTTSPGNREVIINRLLEGLEKNGSWVELYIATGELNIPPIEELDDDLKSMLLKVKEALSSNRPEITEGWRDLKIPLDVPRVDIIAAAKIRILSSPFSTEESPSHRLPALYAGQPISAVMTVTTSFHWGSNSEAKKRSYRMRFDVEEMIKVWLVSGRKRGDFIATDGATYEVPLTLIALNHGELSLPKVAITPLPVADGSAMGSTAVPTTETYQVHGAEKVLILPRGGRSTFVLDMGSPMSYSR
ncbi:hypothetical protein JAAARDRAFT_172897 [Jaapia argillacea MUCL 33604]|uniref:Trafficking protein particle complex subunit 10 n=1 Tax=Jaapia argillacea MUCL 33604 TaxID=933084 RepID=A0A067QDR7_9AGAM|nr:hypothetical protein JAAARDRAFT_172897 [Jaapia argillacea MUCL 33604]